MQYHEVVVDDETNIMRNLVEVSLDEADDVIDLRAGDLTGEVAVRVNVTEALALIEVLSVAARHALTNRAAFATDERTG